MEDERRITGTLIGAFFKEKRRKKVSTKVWPSAVDWRRRAWYEQGGRISCPENFL